MNTLFKLLSGIVLLSIVGCDIENIDKSPPEYVTMWEKPGADSTEVGKALLECGMPSLMDLDSENRKQSINAKATTYACMIQAGFHYKDKWGGDGVILLKRKTSRFVVQELSFQGAVSKSA